MKFTELLAEIKATYREQPRAFHVLATRYYLGKETRQTLQLQINKGYLSPSQAKAIIDNR